MPAKQSQKKSVQQKIMDFKNKLIEDNEKYTQSQQGKYKPFKFQEAITKVDELLYSDAQDMVKQETLKQLKKQYGLQIYYQYNQNQTHRYVNKNQEITVCQRCQTELKDDNTILCQDGSIECRECGNIVQEEIKKTNSTQNKQEDQNKKCLEQIKLYQGTVDKFPYFVANFINYEIEADILEGSFQIVLQDQQQEDQQQHSKKIQFPLRFYNVDYCKNKNITDENRNVIKHQIVYKPNLELISKQLKLDIQDENQQQFIYLYIKELSVNELSQLFRQNRKLNDEKKSPNICQYTPDHNKYIQTIYRQIYDIKSYFTQQEIDLILLHYKNYLQIQRQNQLENQGNLTIVQQFVYQAIIELKLNQDMLIFFKGKKVNDQVILYFKSPESKNIQ